MSSGVTEGPENLQREPNGDGITEQIFESPEVRTVPTRPSRPEVYKPRRSHRKQRRALAAGLGVVALVLVAAAIVYLASDDGSETTLATGDQDECDPAGSEPCDTDIADVPAATAAAESSTTPTATATPRPTATPSPTPTTTPTPVQIVPHPPEEVTVRIANGTRIGGRAGDATTTLAREGYVTLSPADARVQVSRSKIYWAPGFDHDAVVIASLLGLDDPEYIELADGPPAELTPGAAQVAVVLGPE